jgi:selenide,water dikinase
MQEAGCTVIGGHSVRDVEMKFGYAVTGVIRPDEVLTNARAREDDVLLLTKGLGTGVITTALKQRKAKPEWVVGAVRSMTTLNQRALNLARGYEIHAATDVTGFGLIGHCRELALGSRVHLSIDIEAIPLLEGALEAVRLGAIPARLLTNREFAECIVGDARGCAPISEELRALLYDPLTAGGLLLSVAPQHAEPLLAGFLAGGLSAARIGNVLAIDSSPEGAPPCRGTDGVCPRCLGQRGSPSGIERIKIGLIWSDPVNSAQ